MLHLVEAWPVTAAEQTSPRTLESAGGRPSIPDDPTHSGLDPRWHEILQHGKFRMTVGSLPVGCALADGAIEDHMAVGYVEVPSDKFVSHSV